MNTQITLKIGSLLSSFRDLLFPPVCAACGKALEEGEKSLCSFCRADMPLTENWREPENELYRLFRGTCELESASAFYFYDKESHYANIIRNIKFKNQRRLGREMGFWYGSQLCAESELYYGADKIIPLPLHPRRKLWRGFNHAEDIAEGMAEAMDIELDTESLVRVKYSAPQSRQRSRSERVLNIQDAFDVPDVSKLEGKYIILVDDVVTTGSTIRDCIMMLNKKVPSCRVSLASLSFVHEIKYVKKYYTL